MVETHEDKTCRVNYLAAIAILLGVVLLLLGVFSEWMEFVILVFVVASVAGCVLLALGRLILRRSPFAAPSAVFWIVVELATLVWSASVIWSYERSIGTGIE